MLSSEEKAIDQINANLKRKRLPTITEWEIDSRGPFYHARVYGRNGNRKKTYTGLGYVKYNKNDRDHCCAQVNGKTCGVREAYSVDKKSGKIVFRVRKAIHIDPKHPNHHTFKNNPQSHGMGRKLALSRAVQDLVRDYKGSN